MKKYGKNTRGAVTRVLAMVPMVTRDLTENQKHILGGFLLTKEMHPKEVLEAAADYEKDVLKLQKKEKEFLNGDAAFPKSLVHKAWGEITDTDTQFSLAQLMMRMMSADGTPTKKQVLFVEAAVGYWGIGSSWRKWLQKNILREAEQAEQAS